jgi:hypothetical protein
MKTIYRAENVFDASLVRDLLGQADIMAFVQGAVLQGGIGELPASGLVTVSVADEDASAARDIVEAFEAGNIEPADERTSDLAGGMLKPSA